MFQWRRWLIYVAAFLFSAPLMAQRDVLRDLTRALRRPRALGDVLIRTEILVVAPDEMVFNHFRSALPTGARVQYFPLTDPLLRPSDLEQFSGSVVILLDRSRGRFPIEQRHLVPYDLTLIRRQDLVVAGDLDQINRQVRYRLFVSAPSLPGLKRGISDLLTRTVREPRDMRFQIVRPVRLWVVVSNGGKEAFEAFSQAAATDFLWVAPEDLSAAEDLLVTETEIYLMVPPVPDRLKHRYPFDPARLGPNQSVVARQSKGGDFYQVLIYGAFPGALDGLIRQYPDPSLIPDEPVIITHPVVGSSRRLLVVPFADVPRYRERVGDFAVQTFRVLQACGLAKEVIMAPRPPADLTDFRPFQDGSVEPSQVIQLAKAGDADLVIAGRLLDFEPLSVVRNEITSSPSPAADKRIWIVTSYRDETLTVPLEVRLYDGQTGEAIWTRTIEGSARTSVRLTSWRAEGPYPPAVEPDRTVPSLREQRLYPSAVADALAKLVGAMKWEIFWTQEQSGRVIVTPAPVPPVEGIIGRVDGPFVYLDVGSHQGIREGDVFLLYRIVVVKTERKVVRLEEEAGRAVVVELFPEVCKARLEGEPKVPLEAGMRARLLPRPVPTRVQEAPETDEEKKEKKEETQEEKSSPTEPSRFNKQPSR